MTTVTGILLIAWIALAVLNTISAWRYTWGLPLAEIPGTTPRAAVIVAVKNVSNTTRAFFERLRHQSYPDYRIIVAVESEDDPVFGMVSEAAKKPGAPLRIVVAGLSERTGQKVWNLLAALDAIEERDEIVAFVDADTLPTPEWLPRLVAALVNTKRDAVTGYRWIVPSDNRVSSAVVAAANASVVTVLRLPSIVNHCWGGTMAMRRETLERINIRRYWEGALSDDAQMTRAFNDAGYPVYSPRQSLLLSPVSMSWSEAFSFGRRQYRIVLLHDSGIWALAAAGVLFPIAAAGFALVLAWHGSGFATAVIGLSLGLGEIRHRCRRKIVTALWGEETEGRLATYWMVERWLRPLWWSFHALCIICALGSRHIRWAGIDYWIRGPQDIIVSRPPAAAKLQEAADV